METRPSGPSIETKWLLLIGVAVLALVVLVVSFRKSHQKSAGVSVAPGNVEVHFSPKGGCTDAVVRELGKATSSVRIQAYSFTSEPIAKAILDAKARGVKVEAVLDRDNWTDKYSAATFLKNQGCDVRIDAKHQIAHNKVIIIDDKTLITGSFNFTKSAENSNAENMLVIHDAPDLVAKYIDNFKVHQKHSEPYTGPIERPGRTPEATGNGNEAEPRRSEPPPKRQRTRPRSRTRQPAGR